MTVKLPVFPFSPRAFKVLFAAALARGACCASRLDRGRRSHAPFRLTASSDVTACGC